MAPSADDFRKIAEEAGRNLNTYENKTGAHKQNSSDDAGVDSRVVNQFPGGSVKTGDELSTNAGYNKRIPPEEGGDLDARGRQTRGEHFEGVGGPEHKFERQMQDYGGHNELDLTDKRRHDISASSVRDDTSNAYASEAMTVGSEAVQSNIEGTGPLKNQFPGGAYRRQDTGDMSAEGYEAPGSVTEASRESARYQ